MGKNVISIKKYQNKFNEKSMLFLIIAACIIVASVFWKIYIEDQEILEAPIPASQNITYDKNSPAGITPADIADQVKKGQNGPILVYFYTTWCNSCVENFPKFNEVAREFQNTDLTIIPVAIDSKINRGSFIKFLENKGDIYFKPQFLESREGFAEILQQFNIKYTGRIPFTTVLSGEGEILLKYNGTRSPRKLRLAIRKELLED